jgi:hypothetical protein
MKPKQEEMDDVIKIIYNAILEQDARRKEANPSARPSLLILLGDHGMNEVKENEIAAETIVTCHHLLTGSVN